MNFMEVFSDAVKPFLDGDKPPLHVGEVMNLWFYYTATEQTMKGEQVSFNNVKDDELREKLKVVIEDVHGPILEELTAFMKAEGIPLPPSTPNKQLTGFQEIPADVKLNDEEAANLISFNIVLGITYACKGMTEAVRPDVAAMFVRFQMKKMAFAVVLRDLLQKRGWLKIPPYYYGAEADTTAK